MKYLTGEQIEVGDYVMIENGKTEGRVFAIIETIEEAETWGLDDIGISIEAEPFGLVFYPITEKNDPVIFKGRSK